jgi:hypothetical protein
MSLFAEDKTTAFTIFDRGALANYSPCENASDLFIYQISDLKPQNLFLQKYKSVGNFFLNLCFSRVFLGEYIGNIVYMKWL